MTFVKAKSEYLRIGELAEEAGVSVATIKYYIREGLLPPPPVKTGRTMGYYDLAYLERLRLIRKLREEHFLPLRVIRSILAEHADRPLAPGEAELLARVGPAVLRRLDPVDAPSGPIGRDELIERFGLTSDDLGLLEEMGLVGEGGDRRHYGELDVQLLEALAGAEASGIRRDRFPLEGLGHYVELLGELARREVRRFTRQVEGMPADEAQSLAERAIEISEPIVSVIRRKLILRALRSELVKEKQRRHKHDAGDRPDPGASRRAKKEGA